MKSFKRKEKDLTEFFKKIDQKYPELKDQVLRKKVLAFYQLEQLTKWQWFYLIIMIVGMLLSGIAGGYFVHYLTKDTGPLLFVNFDDRVDLQQLEITLTNGKDNVAADIKVEPSLRLNGKKVYYPISILERGATKAIFELDPYYIMHEAIKREENLVTIKGDTIESGMLRSDIHVTCKNCRENDIIYIDKTFWFNVECKETSGFNIEYLRDPIINALYDSFEESFAKSKERFDCRITSGSYR